MSIDKSLYSAPEGEDVAVLDEPEATIEIELPPEEGEEKEAPEEEEAEFDANLAEFMEAPKLLTIISTINDDVQNDLQARREWEDMYREGIKLLGLKFEERTEPWPGACGVFHPVMAEAVVRFQSDTIMETFPAGGPVKTKIVGKQTQDKIDAAQRVEEDMNWQVLDNMVEFRPEHEKMLWTLPAAGSAFKKVYKDESLGRQTSVFVPPEDVIIPYGVSELTTCYRTTHRMRKTKDEVELMQLNGVWKDVDIGDPPRQADQLQREKNKETGVSDINDKRFIIYEACVDLDLPGFEDKKDGEPTGRLLPYVVTFVDQTLTVLSIRRNWREDDKKRQRRLHYVHYQYIPGFGAYGFGLFHLIGGYTKSATSIIRQLVDAGTLSNLPGGLKTKGLRIKGEDTPISPGEFRDVDIGSGTMHDNIMTLPYKEPSQVLAGLLDNIVEEARRFGSTADMKMSDMSAQAPVGTTLAVLERMLKVMSAVQARVHYSFKQELRLIADYVRDDTPKNEEYDYDVDAPDGRKAKYEDYRYTSIIPVSDPNAATMSQRLLQYQAVIQLAAGAPQIYNLPELHRQMLFVLGIKNIEKLVPMEDDLKPTDPVQENQNALAGKPLKAFAYQDHESHIKVHMMAMQDPMVMQLIGQNPKAQMIQAAMYAHVAEHVGYAYRNKIATALGAPLPEYEKDDGLPAEFEYQLSKLLAQAAPQVLAQSQAMVANQQAQKNAQDPLLQIQMQELAVKQQSANTAAKKIILDAAAKADELDLRKQLDTMRIELEGLKAGIDMADKKAKLGFSALQEGIGVAKHHAEQKTQQDQIAAQSAQAAQQPQPGGEE